jgi:hypothetical protein
MTIDTGIPIRRIGGYQKKSTGRKYIVPGWRYLLGYNRLSHLIVHTFYSPATVGVTIAQLQTQELSNSRRLSYLEAS